MIRNIILLYHYYIGFILKIKWYWINVAYTLAFYHLFGENRPRWWKSDGCTKICHLPPGLTILIITGLTWGFKWGRIPDQGGYWHRVEFSLKKHFLIYSRFINFCCPTNGILQTSNDFFFSFFFFFLFFYVVCLLFFILSRTIIRS